jgi:hypothetical protein
MDRIEQISHAKLKFPTELETCKREFSLVKFWDLFAGFSL